MSCDESAETIRDRGATVEGWVVLRELEDFKNLHDKLKEVGEMSNFELLSDDSLGIFQRFSE